MKASKFSGARKAFIVKQGKEGIPVAEICWKAEIIQATYFKMQQYCLRGAGDWAESQGSNGRYVPLRLTFFVLRDPAGRCRLWRADAAGYRMPASSLPDKRSGAVGAEIDGNATD